MMVVRYSLAMKTSVLAILILALLGFNLVDAWFNINTNNNNNYEQELNKKKLLQVRYPKFKVKPLPINNTTQCCGGTQNFYPFTAGFSTIVNPVAAPGGGGTECLAIYNATGPVTISELNLQGWAVTRQSMPSAIDARYLSIALFHKQFQESTPSLIIPHDTITQPTITDGSQTLWMHWMSSTCERDSFPFEYSTVRDPLFSALHMDAQDQLLICTLGVNSNVATFSDDYGWTVSGQFSYTFTFP